VLQPSEDSLRQFIEAGHLLFEVSAAEGGYAVGSATVVGIERANPAALDEAGDGAGLL